MTYQEKIKWLGRYRRAIGKERFLEGEIETLRSDATRMTARLSGMPGAQADPNRIARSVESLTEAQEKLEKQVQSCVACRCEITQGISEIEHPARREVLRRRYILGQSYQQIADEMGLVERRVYQLHRGGVQSLPELPGSTAAAEAGKDAENLQESFS